VLLSYDLRLVRILLAFFPPCAPPHQFKPPTSPKSPIISTKTSKPLTNTRNWLFYTGTYGVSAPLLSKIFDICNATLYDFNPPGGVVWSIAFEPLPTLVTEHGSLKGGNSLGTSPKDGNAVSKSLRTSITLPSIPNFPSTLYSLPPTHYPLTPPTKTPYSPPPRRPLAHPRLQPSHLTNRTSPPQRHQPPSPRHEPAAQVPVPQLRGPEPGPHWQLWGGECGETEEGECEV